MDSELRASDAGSRQWWQAGNPPSEPELLLLCKGCGKTSQGAAGRIKGLGNNDGKALASAQHIINTLAATLGVPTLWLVSDQL